MKLISCNQNKFIFYQVQKGDTLTTILQKFSVTSKNIVRNDPKVDLYEGEIIKITFTINLQHIVKPMETLNAIAQKYNVEVETLIKLNDLKSKRLFVGQMLTIKDCEHD